jgi:hypothetical protein
MQAKVMVAKQGTVYRVAVDPVSGMPMNLSSHADEPAGAFMFTYTDDAELRAAWPGRDLVFLEAPKKAENAVAPLSSQLQRQADQLLEKVVSTVKGKEAEAWASETNTPLPKPDVGNQTLSGAYVRSQEFLKRLETAREYASKKNQRELDVKIAAIKELLSEVFGE